MGKDPCFIPFKKDVSQIELPEQFNYPFAYDPHPLTIQASKEVQADLETQKDWEHNFGLIPGQEGDVIGKMFGVLVVKNKEGELGYLKAFSGKLANANHHPGFVPPLFDMLEPDSFFQVGTQYLNGLNAELEARLKDPDYLKVLDFLKSVEKEAAEAIFNKKEAVKANKKRRKAIRKEAEANLDQVDFEALKEEHKSESIMQRYFLVQLEKEWAEQVEEARKKVEVFQEKIDAIKENRKQRSNQIQQELFDQYHFLNINGESKSLLKIFEATTVKVPPAGAGECAAPKLLQYAFANQYEPIAMAEFWWGQSPKSEVRQHRQFYPSCNSKCKPILGHMLEGMNVESNPLLDNPGQGKELEIIYEDEAMIVVNKPAEFLSVPGKSIRDSVYTRIKEEYELEGPVIVHRLDMSTSGIMVLAKNKEVHKVLQAQFINRTVNKRYEAILEGVLEVAEGFVELPLRVDLDDRPRQLVCYEHGKPARTKFKRIAVEGGRTRVHFFPITGRTHQLRVHAAHREGLGIPILGDDLYGQKDSRLHLHAAQINLKHPITGEGIQFKVRADF
jgi:tRNA pseudouridine32 synthase/23S rRNA pseudouridine746 synthase